MLQGCAGCLAARSGTSRQTGERYDGRRNRGDVHAWPALLAALGWRFLGADIARGWIKVEFDGRSEFLNPAGRVQGGILAAMLDDTMGPAVLVKSEGALYPSSIDMNISFLGAAKRGRLVCEGEVLRLGKTVGFVEGRLMDAAGRLLVRATSSVMLVPAERLAPDSGLRVAPRMCR